MIMTSYNPGSLIVLGGAVYVGGPTVAPPASASEVLPAGWEALGRYSEDGLTEARERATATIRDQWGEVTFETVTESGVTYKAKFRDTTPATLNQYYGSAPDAEGTQTVVPAELPKRSPFVIDCVVSDERGQRHLERHYIPVGQVISTGDRPRKKGSALEYEMTIRAFPSPLILDPATGQAGSVRIFRAPITA
jgi:hypothetical protein